MAQAAQERGCSYLAITDHSKRVTIAHGLDAKRLAAQIDEIARLNETLSGIVVLSSVEVDIVEDGRLDLLNSILRWLDLVVGAVHSAFSLSRAKQTERLLRPMDNPHLSVLAHPTGRLIGSASYWRRASPAARSNCHVVGIVSEGDLLGQPPSGRPRAWWLLLFNEDTV
jgi:DNA polymerase (family X)